MQISEVSCWEGDTRYCVGAVCWLWSLGRCLLPACVNPALMSSKAVSCGWLDLGSIFFDSRDAPVISCAPSRPHSLSAAPDPTEPLAVSSASSFDGSSPSKGRSYRMPTGFNSLSVPRTWETNHRHSSLNLVVVSVFTPQLYLQDCPH